MPTSSQGPRLLKGAIVAIDRATSARVLPGADLVRTLVRKPGQRRLELFDGLGGLPQPRGWEIGIKKVKAALRAA